MPCKYTAAADIDIFIFNLKKRYSGVSATVFSLLPALSETINVTYVSKHAESDDDKLPKQCKKLTLWQAIRCCRQPMPRKQRKIWHLRRNNEMLIALLCRDVLRLPIRLVFTSASIRRHSAFPRWLIAQMDAVIATSNDAAKWLNKCSKVIGHGVDTHRFHPPKNINNTYTPEQLLSDKQKAWQSLDFGGRLGIGIFGRVREEKGIHFFIDAMIALLPHHPQYTAFIAGLCKPSDQAFLNNLKKRINDAELNQQIVFLGNILPEDMPKLYQATLITVACPLYEGFGLTVLESMASGCAVVASRTGAFPRLVNHGSTGHLVDVGDVASLTTALDDLMSHPVKAAAWGLEAINRAQHHFSCQQEAQGIVQVYRSLMDLD